MSNILPVLHPIELCASFHKGGHQIREYLQFVNLHASDLDSNKQSSDNNGARVMSDKCVQFLFPKLPVFVLYMDFARY